VVVAVDDEQWLDADTRRLLQIAVARLSAGRGLVPVPEHDAFGAS
jgi:hypothetical protein